MQIVLSGALPDPAEARELIRYMQDTAPTLCRWLSTYQAREHTVDPAQSLCTPAEHYQLQQASFKAEHAGHISAGLAPLLLQQEKKRTDYQADEKIWLAQLVHIAPARDGAMLIPARELGISAAESHALLRDFAPFSNDSPFTFKPCTTEHWQIQVPPEFTTPSASPELVAMSSVNDWWSQDQRARPWRQLANEFQMFCFNHPINQSRQQEGRLSINSLWLYGGASLSQFPASMNTDNTLYLPSLQASFLSRDWGDWLQQLKALEQSVFAPRADLVPEKLVLLGRDRYRVCQPAPSKIWPLRLFQKPQPWSRWWSPLS